MAPGPAADYEATPQIDAVWLSSLTLERGGKWDGEITTPSNVASIEVRTDSFSFSVPRIKPGVFAFSYAIFDLPPYLRRQFVLHVVARNAAGDTFDEPLPIEILQVSSRAGTIVPLTSPKSTRSLPSPHQPRKVTVSPSSRKPRRVPSSRASGFVPRDVSSIALP